MIEHATTSNSNKTFIQFSLPAWYRVFFSSSSMISWFVLLHIRLLYYPMLWRLVSHHPSTISSSEWKQKFSMSPPSFQFSWSQHKYGEVCISHQCCYSVANNYLKESMNDAMLQVSFSIIAQNKIIHKSRIILIY